MYNSFSLLWEIVKKTQRPATERKIAFADVAAAADVPMEEVCHILCHALTKEILRVSLTLLRIVRNTYQHMPLRFDVW